MIAGTLGGRLQWRFDWSGKGCVWEVTSGSYGSYSSAGAFSTILDLHIPSCLEPLSWAYVILDVLSGQCWQIWDFLYYAVWILPPIENNLEYAGYGLGWVLFRRKMLWSLQTNYVYLHFLFARSGHHSTKKVRVMLWPHCLWCSCSVPTSLWWSAYTGRCIGSRNCLMICGGTPSTDVGWKEQRNI